MDTVKETKGRDSGMGKNTGHPLGGVQKDKTRDMGDIKMGSLTQNFPELEACSIPNKTLRHG
jgi:hypothetical protein